MDIKSTLLGYKNQASDLASSAKAALTIPGVGTKKSEVTGRLQPVTATPAQVEDQAEPRPDLRVRLRAQTGNEEQVYGPQMPSNILSILHETNGILFPFTPSIDWNQSVEYATMSFTHGIQDQLSFKSTPSTALSINGEFTCQNQREAEYLLAVMHFFRVVSKMYYGESDPKAGMPPPLLTFEGYGNYMFNSLPVIVKSHSYSLGKEVDYVDAYIAEEWVKVPALISINVQLVVQNTPTSLRKEFNLDQFRTGELMRNGKKGWI